MSLMKALKAHFEDNGYKCKAVPNNSIVDGLLSRNGIDTYIKIYTKKDNKDVIISSQELSDLFTKSLSNNVGILLLVVDLNTCIMYSKPFGRLQFTALFSGGLKLDLSTFQSEHLTYLKLFKINPISVQINELIKRLSKLLNISNIELIDTIFTHSKTKTPELYNLISLKNNTCVQEDKVSIVKQFFIQNGFSWEDNNISYKVTGKLSQLYVYVISDNSFKDTVKMYAKDFNDLVDFYRTTKEPTYLCLVNRATKDIYICSVEKLCNLSKVAMDSYVEFFTNLFYKLTPDVPFITLEKMLSELGSSQIKEIMTILGRGRVPVGLPID